ncbi:hypothetical protein Tcan_06531 [Toxocara canis]|uniref:Uncharacterized protein n=1 Tax=Toxocara canis TaxID=6265 RepID=A0A0B2VQY2_TOXCA|nr:hypothetical protein Tcan_06531 [Toxocara canis]
MEESDEIWVGWKDEGFCKREFCDSRCFLFLSASCGHLPPPASTTQLQALTLSFIGSSNDDPSALTPHKEITDAGVSTSHLARTSKSAYRCLDAAKEQQANHTKTLHHLTPFDRIRFEEKPNKSCKKKNKSEKD